MEKKQAQQQRKRKEEAATAQQQNDNDDDDNAPQLTRLYNKSNKKATKDDTERLGSLQSLTAAIEAKLEKSRRHQRASSYGSQNRDAMAEVLRHNDDCQPHPNATAVKHVAIVLTKPLQNDRVTLEHAQRVRRLVRAMQHESYRPHVICFVGGQGPGNLVADADASYLFFLELCAAQHVPVHGIDIHLVKGSVQEGALEQISYFLKETCSPLWNLELQKQLGKSQQQQQQQQNISKKSIPPPPSSASTKQPKSGLLGQPGEGNGDKDAQPEDPLQSPSRKLHVHFSLVSSEYELCQLNDMHDRSPGRSPLRALSTWSSRSFETTWDYLYTTTILPAEESNDVTRMFRTKTFRSAQELIPVLQHIRGVAENKEFFQLEAYRVLVAARRSIVKDMELLYHRPKNAQGVTMDRQEVKVLIQNQQQSVDVVLEAALLSLGRCLDLVRPAGNGDKVVASSDWKLAAVLLEKAISQILRVCDVDRPLDPGEWGRMGNDDENNQDKNDDENDDDDDDDNQPQQQETNDINLEQDGQNNADKWSLSLKEKEAVTFVFVFVVSTFVSSSSKRTTTKNMRYGVSTTFDILFVNEKKKATRITRGYTTLSTKCDAVVGGSLPQQRTRPLSVQLNDRAVISRYSFFLFLFLQHFLLLNEDTLCHDTFSLIAVNAPWLFDYVADTASSMAQVDPIVVFFLFSFRFVSFGDTYKPFYI